MLDILVQYFFNQIKAKLFALFMNFKAAFPSLNHALLWFKLHKVGISSKIINILISLYCHERMLIKSGGSLSEEIEVEVREDVLQEEILSPLLFAIYLADLEEFLRTRGVPGIYIHWSANKIAPTGICG